VPTVLVRSRLQERLTSASAQRSGAVFLLRIARMLAERRSSAVLVAFFLTFRKDKFLPSQSKISLLGKPFQPLRLCDKNAP
jgi:hypothetical protein